MSFSIKKIKIYQLKMTLKNPFQTSFGTIKDKHFYIIEVIDHIGNKGYGESVAFSTPWYTEETTQTNIHIIKDFLIKILKNNPIEHPSQVSEIFGSVIGNNMAKAAVESALWDLYAKQKGIPLSIALGGEKLSIDVGISLGIQPTISELLKKIDTYNKAGYKRIKIKIKPGYDIDVLKEVRHSFPRISLMADANGAYTLRDGDHLKKLDDLKLDMIEQPLAHNDLIDHAKLQKEMKTPICLDESIHSFEDVKIAVKLGSCKIINIKSGRVGGLTEAKKIHDYCKQYNIPVWCGGMLESGIGRAHNIALATLTNFTLPGDIGPSSHYWDKDIIKPEVKVVNGQIQVPQQPGIGYNFDFESIGDFIVGTEVFMF